jgi:hypothetical protein
VHPVDGLVAVNDLDILFPDDLAESRREADIDRQLPVKADIIDARLTKVFLERPSSSRTNKCHLETEAGSVTTYIKRLRLGAAAIYGIE